MGSRDDSALGAGRVVPLDHTAPTAAWWAAVAMAFGLAACAGSSPQPQVAAADASQAATVQSDVAGPAAAEAAVAASQEPQAGSADSAESETVSDAAPVPPPAAPSPDEPQATADPVPPEPPAVATQTAAVPSQIANDTSSIPPAGSGLATRHPYVVIRFTESNVDYEEALSEAVKRAVARKPNLAFDLVAVTPRAATAEDLADQTEQAHAEAAAVMKSLSALGIGPDRVNIMTWTGQPIDVNEIRLYIR